jgi:hypothetical protein
VEQVGIVYGLTDQFAERFRLSGIGYRQLDLLEPSGDRRIQPSARFSS